MQKTKRVKNPGKQRKRLFNAPAHIRHKLMSAPLSSELAASRGVKTLPVRKGDTVRIMRGDNKGFEGKVSRVALKEYRIYMEGLTREKVDGTNIFLPIHPSKIQIRNLNLDDKWRKDILTRKKQIEKPERKAKPKAAASKEAKEAPAKPEEKVEEIAEVEEEKSEEAMPLEEAVTEVVKEEAPAETVVEVEEAPEEAPAEKKPRAKKPLAKAAKKVAAKKEKAPEKKVTKEEEEAPAEKEKAPAKKAAKPMAAKPKEAPAKRAAAKKTAVKPRAKIKASKEAEGEQ
jgi:large subunit ribosomal protein L24